MRRLTILVAVLAAIYGGYWFVGANAVESAARDGLADLETQGWDIAYDTLETKGFPSRFDTTISNIAVTSADGGTRYGADMVQVLALSYQPNEVIAAFPPIQSIAISGEPFDILSDGLRASVSVAANTALSLSAVTTEAASGAVNYGDTQLMAFDNLLAAMRASGPAPHSYDMYFSMDDIALPGAQLISPAFPVALSVARLDATVTLDRDLDRHNLATWEDDPAQLRALSLKDFNIAWEDYVVSGAGDMTVDADGVGEGTITVTITEWRKLLDFAIAQRIVPDNMAFVAVSMGETLSEGADTLSLPITIQNGNLSIGPFPLGPAPRFH